MSELPPILVVTGTDTDVGKTVVSAALAAALVTSGPVAMYKPVQTGVGPDDPGDASRVADLGGAATYEGARLGEPLAPTTAARRAGVELPAVSEHARRVEELADSHPLVIVEGAGGVLVGLDSTGATLVGLARALRRPFAFVVVCRAGLGTLNHSALTVDALRSAGQRVLGCVVGRWPTDPDVAAASNVSDLPVVTRVPLLGKVPDGAGGYEPARFRTEAASWFAPPIGSAP